MCNEFCSPLTLCFYSQIFVCCYVKCCLPRGNGILIVTAVWAFSGFKQNNWIILEVILLFRRLTRTVQPVTLPEGAWGWRFLPVWKRAEASLVTHTTREGEVSRQITCVTLSSLFVCVLCTSVSGGCWRTHVTCPGVHKGYIKAQLHQFDYLMCCISSSFDPIFAPSPFLSFRPSLFLFFMKINQESHAVLPTGHLKGCRLQSTRPQVMINV